MERIKESFKNNEKHKNNKQLTSGVVLFLLHKHGEASARVLAADLREEGHAWARKKEVNQILYQMEKENQVYIVRRDNQKPVWKPREAETQ